MEGGLGGGEGCGGGGDGDGGRGLGGNGRGFGGGGRGRGGGDGGRLAALAVHREAMASRRKPSLATGLSLGVLMASQAWRGAVLRPLRGRGTAEYKRGTDEGRAAGRSGAAPSSSRSNNKLLRPVKALAKRPGSRPPAGGSLPSRPSTVARVLRTKMGLPSTNHAFWGPPRAPECRNTHWTANLLWQGTVYSGASPLESELLLPDVGTVGESSDHP